MKSKNVLSKIKNYLFDELKYFKNSVNAIRAERDIDILSAQTSMYIKQQIGSDLEKLRGEPLLASSDDYKVPVVIDENFSKFLLKFMHSYRNIEHPTININNLLFLTGPEKNGKSWFLRHNLKKFAEEESDKRTLVIHYNIAEINNQTFSSFLFNFENEIIKSIVQRNQYEYNKNKKYLISIENLKDILFYRWDQGWIEINLSKCLKRSVNDLDNESPYTFFINKAKYKDEILELIEKYERKVFKEYIFVNEFNRLVDIISDSMTIDKLNAGLLLIQDCLIQREDYRKNQLIFEGELYRDGLEVMEYFFDVLNFVSGYHETQLKILQDAEAPMKLYPHIVLALESTGMLLDMKDAENRPKDYLHRIMLRLYNNSGYRNHFPVILESNKNHYFDRTIYEEMWEMKYTFPSLVYLPAQFWNTIEKTLDNIFNNYQKNYTLALLGDSSVYHYDAYVEAIKAHDQRKTFPNTGSYFESEYNKFRYKLNKVYINPRMALLLDKGKIDYEILNHLRQWQKIYIKHDQPYIGIRREVYDYEYLNLPVTMALFEENITFYNKYFKRVHFEHFVMNLFNNKAYKSLHEEKLNSIWKKIYFNYYYYPFKGFKFSIDHYAIGQKKYLFKYIREGWDFSSKDWIYGSNLKWDVPNELYKGNNIQSYYFRTYQSTSDIQ